MNPYLCSSNTFHFKEILSAAESTWPNSFLILAGPGYCKQGMKVQNFSQCELKGELVYKYIYFYMLFSWPVLSSLKKKNHYFVSHLAIFETDFFC